MPRTIDEYCDIAIEKNKLKSDGQLSKELKVTRSAVSAWRTKKAWPSEEKMIELAKLAGANEVEALIDLAELRTYGTKVGKTYKKLHDILNKAVAAGLLSFVMVNVTIDDGTNAGKPSTQRNICQHILSNYVYYE